MAKVVDSHERVLAALLSSTTRKEAAIKAGVSERTVYEYLQDADFAARYAALRKGLVTDAAAQLQQGLSPAIATLRAIVTDGQADIRVRVASARALLEYGIKYSELSDVYTQLEGKEEESDNLYQAVLVAVKVQCDNAN
ncbi:MAG: hypothetical protein GX418_12330 [Clostridiales bacterium]|nr:hypothetical protein [Clostridiales bacterium]